MTQYKAPVAIGQFAIGQGTAGSGTTSFVVETLALAVSLQPVTLSRVNALIIGTLPIQITTFAVSLHLQNHMEIERLNVVTTFNPVTRSNYANLVIDPLHISVTFTDVHKLYDLRMQIGTLPITVAMQPVAALTGSTLQIMPMQVSVTFNDVHELRGLRADTLPVTVSMKKVTFRGAVRLLVDTLPIHITMNTVSFAYNGDPLHGNYKLPVDTLPIHVTMNPVTLRAPTNALLIDTMPIVVSLKDVYLNRGNELVLADAIRVTDRLAALASYTFSERVATADLFGSALTALLSQRIGISGALSAQAVYGLAVAEATTVRDILLSATQVHLVDALVGADTLDVVATVTLLDRLMLSGTMDVTAYFNLSLADRIKLTGAVKGYLGVDMVEQIDLADALDLLWRFRESVAEGVVLTDDLTRFVLATVDHLERIDVSGELLAQAIYIEDLITRIAVTVGRAKLSGSATAWAINTRSNNVTEYKNWNFNSFAKLGNLYIAANDQGVFQLAGDTDAGAPIQTTVRSAMFQPGGSRLTALKCAYIGAMVTKGTRDVERVFLKLITDDDLERVYRAMPLNRRTSRVNFGKGLRSRYYAWELTTTDVDFDLDTVEFIPVQAKRRV